MRVDIDQVCKVEKKSDDGWFRMRLFLIWRLGNKIEVIE
jgi:hypothetical protein